MGNKKSTLAERMSDIDLTQVIVPQCHQCQHYHRGTLTCEAYPKGIPRGILMNLVDHRKPYPGDQGIKFEQK